MRTINGRQVKSVKASREAAERGLEDAYDAPKDPQVAALIQLLKDGGYTQRGAALELGISDRMMRYYCAGQQPIPRAVMLALAHLVECAPSN